MYEAIDGPPPYRPGFGENIYYPEQFRSAAGADLKRGETVWIIEPNYKAQVAVAYDSDSTNPMVELRGLGPVRKSEVRLNQSRYDSFRGWYIKAAAPLSLPDVVPQALGAVGGAVVGYSVGNLPGAAIGAVAGGMATHYYSQPKYKSEPSARPLYEDCDGTDQCRATRHDLGCRGAGRDCRRRRGTRMKRRAKSRRTRR